MNSYSMYYDDVLKIMKQYFWANQDAEFGMLAVLKKWTELEDSDDNW